MYASCFNISNNHIQIITIHSLNLKDYEKYFEKTDHRYATRNNLNSVKLPKEKLETGRKGFYFLAAKAFNALPSEVGCIKYRNLFRNALEEHCK